MIRVTEDVARQIRQMYGSGPWTAEQVAESFGLSRGTITDVLTGFRHPQVALEDEVKNLVQARREAKREARKNESV